MNSSYRKLVHEHSESPVSCSFGAASEIWLSTVTLHVSRLIWLAGRLAEVVISDQNLAWLPRIPSEPDRLLNNSENADPAPILGFLSIPLLELAH